MHQSKILLLIAALAGASCQFKASEQNMARAAALLNPRREASLAYWKDKTLHARPALEYPALVSSILLPPEVRTTYKLTKLPDGNYQFDMVMSAKGTISAGTAVPLTRDGYFLTAAHCVNGPACSLIVPANDKTLRTVTARVVWRGGNTKDNPDLALIHAPVTPHTTIAMAPLDSVRRNQPVLTGGYGSHGFPNIEHGTSGGRLLAAGKIQQKAGGGKWLRFSHTAPLAAGDSGGPVIGEDGRLIGINTALHSTAFFPLGLNQIWLYRGGGEAADPAWIQSLIKADRARPKKS